MFCKSSLLTMAALLLGWATTSAIAECQTAYVISRRKNLARVNVKTGATEKVAELDPSIRPVGGVAVNDFGDEEIMYVVGNLNTNNATLIKIDRMTGGVIEIVGYLGFRAKGLAVDVATGYLFTLDRYGNKIYKVDPKDATPTLFGNFSSDPLDLEAIGLDSWSGRLYGSKDGDLYQMDVYTPDVITKLGRVKYTFGLDLNSMFFRRKLNNRFYALGKADGQTTHEAPIFVINLDTMEAVYKGASQVISPYGGDLICGIADEFA